MRVVQLEGVRRVIRCFNGYVFGELLPRQALLLERGQHVLYRGGDKEVLLLEAELLPVVGAVVGIENAADTDHVLSVVQSGYVVALVERREVEFLRVTSPLQRHGEGVRLPQTEIDGRVRVVPVDRRVERHRHHLLRVAPLHLLVSPSLSHYDGVAVVVLVLADMPIELDFVPHVLTLNLPRRAEGQPVLRVLDLVPVLADLLLEDSVVVANAIPRGGDVVRGQRVEIARRKTP